jgi:hypothetical protein
MEMFWDGLATPAVSARLGEFSRPAQARFACCRGSADAKKFQALT